MCEHYVLAKQTSDIGIYRIHEKIGYIHSDVWGPSINESMEGRYFVAFIYACLGVCHELEDKVFKIIVNWWKLVDARSGRKIKVLHSKNGDPYTSDPLLKMSGQGHKETLHGERVLVTKGVLDKVLGPRKLHVRVIS